jgi:hypothetical protein
MILYAFGKWGSIKGVHVQKDYSQLTLLFQNIMKEVQVEPEFRNTGFRFYKDSIHITYEEVMEAALLIVAEQAQEEAALELMEEDSEGGLGLWHKIIWQLETNQFIMKKTNDETSTRIGHNFYRVNYICPECQNKLHMTLYPEGKGELIETEEAKVLLARAYTCYNCNSFYTPRPNRLLQEGIVYSMKFDDDRVAYEDYLEHLGRNGSKETSYRFNEYETNPSKNEAEHPSKEQNTEQEWADEVENEEQTVLNEHIENEAAMAQEAKDTAAADAPKKLDKSNKQRFVSGRNSTPTEADAVNKNLAPVGKISSGKDNDTERLQKNLSKRVAYAATMKPTFISGNGKKRKSLIPIEYGSDNKQISRHLDTRKKYDVKMKDIITMDAKELKQLKKQIMKEDELSEADIRDYVRKIDCAAKQIADEDANEIWEGDIGSGRQVMRRQQGRSSKKESILTSEPNVINREQSQKKITAESKPSQTDEVLTGSTYQTTTQPPITGRNQRGNEEWEPSQPQMTQENSTSPQFLNEEEENDEIKRLIRETDYRDRDSLYGLWEKLKSSLFHSHNVSPHLEEIENKLKIMDEAEIAHLCPNPEEVSFEEGLEAYKAIADGLFLPELKQNALELLRKRLLGLKTEENSLLVKKLKKELEAKMKDLSRIYFYEAAEVQRQSEGKPAHETLLMNHALVSYAVSRNEFELPLLVCDSTRQGNGGKGFILTPDHIFYKEILDSGRIQITDIEDVEFNNGRFKKNIFLKLANDVREKLPNGVSPRERAAFAVSLHEFIEYLKEKPESRNLQYLVKEKHEVICCYRCGYTYKGGNICPQCGSKSNQ